MSTATHGSNGNGRPTREYAFDYAAAGLSVVPITIGGSKLPLVRWKHLQSRIAPRPQIAAWFKQPAGVATIGGAVSGGLECIDFDQQGLYEEFAPLVEASMPGLLARCTHHRTPRPGHHVIYRCDVVEGNQALAEAMIEGELKKIIETRGEGGYFLAPGSPAACHETGRLYEHVGGPPITQVSTITVEERELLFSIARSFHRIAEPERKPAGKQPQGDGLSPGDDFAQRTTWHEILEPHGWVEVFRRGEITSWRRPGKTIGISATTGVMSTAGAELFCVFSTNAHPFDKPAGRPCGSYGKFSAYAILNHGGDYSAAAKALAAQGYGDRPRHQPEPDAPSSGQNAHSTDRQNTTDLGNAKRFVAQHGDGIRYCWPWRSWMVWDGKRWAIDQTAAVERLARETVKSIWREAADAQDSDDRKRLAKWAASSEGRDRLSAFVDLARAEPGIPVLHERFDKKPWLLNVQNGTLDLRTGALRPHDPADMITVVAPVPYDHAAAATCSRWLVFIDRIFASNKELIAYVQRWLGYCLTGSIEEHVLTICWGGGSNGKTTLLEAVSRTLGDGYAIQGADHLLMSKHNEQHPTGLADLFGKRFVVTSESDESARLNEGLVKRLTGGEPVRARRMKQDFFEFPPTHKLALVTNHKPTIRGTDLGIWRRIKLIPFNVTIPPAERNKKLLDELRAEATGILAWCVQGCSLWQLDGLGECDAVEMATADYKASEDILADWLADRTEGTEGSTRFSHLYTDYTEWCKRQALQPVGQRRFGVNLGNRGYVKYTNNGTYYRGIQLVSDGFTE